MWNLWLSNFYTYKNLILTIFLPVFDIFIHNLDTITGQDITNPEIFI